MTLRVRLRIGAVSLIAGASRFGRQDVYRSRLPRSLVNRDQCASLVSLILACAAESKSIPIVVSLSGSTGTRSKRNFHRPQSNCGVAINCRCEAFIVDQQTSQILPPARLLELNRDPRIIAAAVANATIALMNGLGAANQKRVFMPLFSSLRKPTFHKT